MIYFLQKTYNYQVQACQRTITGFQCAANPSEYGINESYLWKCSMFTPGSLAEASAIAPYNFNMELSECHKFIPPSTEIWLSNYLALWSSPNSV